VQVAREEGTSYPGGFLGGRFTGASIVVGSFAGAGPDGGGCVSLSTAAKTITTAPAPPTPAVIASGDEARNHIVMWAILCEMVWRSAQETFTAEGCMCQFHCFCFDGLAPVSAQE